MCSIKMFKLKSIYGSIVVYSKWSKIYSSHFIMCMYLFERLVIYEIRLKSITHQTYYALYQFLNAHMRLQLSHVFNKEIALTQYQK